MEHTGHWTKNRPIFFNSFGVDGLKSFIIQDDKKVVEKNTLWDRTTDKNRQQNNSCKYKI